MVHKSSALAAGTGGGTGGGTVSDITSTGGTITITNPTGPTVNLEVSAGGGVSSVFGRTGAVVADYSDYAFNLVSGVAGVSQGGTGLQTLSANGVLLGEGTGNVSAATTGISGRLLVDQGVGVDPAFEPMSGDAVIAATGAITLATVNSNVGSFGSSTSIPNFTVNGKGLLTAAGGNVVVAPAGTLTGTVLASNVTASSLTSVGTLASGSLAIGFTPISNSLLANSAITVGAGTGLSGGGAVPLGGSTTLSLTNTSVTVSGVSGVTGGGTVALGSSITLGMAGNAANTLAGYNSNGAFSDVTIGNSLNLAGGVLSGASSASVTSVFGRIGAVVADWNDYNFNLIGGTASASQGGTGLQTLTAHAVMLGEGTAAVSFATTGAAARILIDQGNANPAFQAISGDASVISTGAWTNLAVHGVTYPASPSTNTIPAILSSNAATYTTALPNGITATTQASTDNSTLIATDAYVTTAITNALAAINPAVAVQAATIQASDTSGLTYFNGVSGVGATFTGANNVTLTIDGFTFNTLGQRLLVKNDTQSANPGAYNGIYYVTTLPGTLQGTILTRALDYDQPSDINNTGAIPVINGTVNASTSWVETAQIVTVGTTPLVFAQFSYNPTTIITTSTTAGGSLTGTYPNPTLAIGAISGGTSISISNSGSVTGITYSGAASGVSTITNTDGSLTISPQTGVVNASLNVGHANTWTATQTGAVSGGITSLISQGCIEFSIFPNGNSGAGTPTLKWANGNIQAVTISGACTLGFTLPANGGRLTVISTQSSGTGFSYAYPSTVLWPSGTIPTLSSASGGIDITSFLYDTINVYGIANTGFLT